MDFSNLNQNQIDFVSKIFVDYTQITDEIRLEGKRYLECQKRPNGTPASVLDPCMKNDYLVRGLECPSISLPETSNFSTVLQMARLGVPPILVQPTWADFELIRSELPCPQGEKRVKLIHLDALGILSTILNIRDGLYIGLFTSDLEVAPRSLENSRFFALEWDSKGKIGSLEFPLSQDLFEGLEGPEGSFLESPSECIFRQEFVRPLSNPT